MVVTESSFSLAWNEFSSRIALNIHMILGPLVHHVRGYKTLLQILAFFFFLPQDLVIVLLGLKITKFEMLLPSPRAKIKQKNIETTFVDLPLFIRSAKTAPPPPPPPSVAICCRLKFTGRWSFFFLTFSAVRCAKPKCIRTKMVSFVIFCRSFRIKKLRPKNGQSSLGVEGCLICEEVKWRISSLSLSFPLSLPLLSLSLPLPSLSFSLSHSPSRFWRVEDRWPSCGLPLWLVTDSNDTDRLCQYRHYLRHDGEYEK